MKRRLLAGFIALVSLMGIRPAQAQVQVGFRGGANWGFASAPSYLRSVLSNLRPTVGPTGAVFLEVPLTDYVSFRPEVSYVQKGVAIHEGTSLNLGVFDLPIGATVAYQSQHIEVPLLAKINMSTGAVRPYLLVGPAVSYAVDGRIRTRASALFSTRPMDIDLNYGGMLNRWDVGAVGGLGFAMDAGAGQLFIEGRYTYGFSRQVQVPVVNINLRNQGVAVSMGYSFPIGSR